MSPTENASSNVTAQPDGLKTDSLAASVAVLLILTVVQRLVGFLRGVLFCRWLDADQLGQWDMAFGFLMLAAPLALLGIPGSFGRYVEYYRQRHQLKTFLRRTSACSMLLMVLAMAAVALGRSWISQLVFGSAEHAGLVLLLAVSLGVVIVHNSLHSLLTALRQVRLVCILQFANSVAFAAAGIGLLLLWQSSTASVVIAFAAACVLTSAVSIIYLARLWTALPAAGPPLPQRSLWVKLMPFAFWLWLTNWLSNLFLITDRLMIIHCGGFTSQRALSLVGQYHTARIFPVLFIGVAELLAAVVTPHLSSDWETGQRDRVGKRLRLILKSFGLGLAAAAALVLIGAPTLFHLAWEDRFAEGLAVLPWALTCSIWTGLAFVSNNYLWCAEKSRYVNLTLAVGLLLNVLLNLLLLPYWGLLGAVLATAAARLVALSLLWAINSNQGMQIDRGLLLVAALPLLLTLDPWISLGAIAIAVLGVVPGLRCLDATETAQLSGEAQRYGHRIRELLGRIGRRRPGDGPATADRLSKWNG
ncbi:MAG: hypothetical protein A2V70_14230 [Planctomycetes bacterium RBG_13_63_9]|nr:MAG: hypothetical protein A2V70_14230 [Planctomycetes bacterium RBG_13_63_9]